MKCFKSGMRRDWIMTDVEREEKRKKIEENRRRKFNNPNLNISGDESASELNTSILSNQPNTSVDNNQMNNNNSNKALRYSFEENDSSMKLPVRRRRRRRQNSSVDKSSTKVKANPVAFNSINDEAPVLNLNSSSNMPASFSETNNRLINVSKNIILFRKNNET